MSRHEHCPVLEENTRDIIEFNWNPMAGQNVYAYSDIPGIVFFQLIKNGSP
jgi:hypothetical protein